MFLPRYAGDGWDSLDLCPIGLGEMKILLAALVKSNKILLSWLLRNGLQPLPFGR